MIGHNGPTVNVSHLNSFYTETKPQRKYSGGGIYTNLCCLCKNFCTFESERSLKRGKWLFLNRHSNIRDRSIIS